MEHPAPPAVGTQLSKNGRTRVVAEILDFTGNTIKDIENWRPGHKQWYNGGWYVWWGPPGKKPSQRTWWTEWVAWAAGATAVTGGPDAV